DPPSPDYILGPEEPEQAPPSPDYVPGPEHAYDKIVAEDQPYVEDASPTVQSPEYVPESDLKAHPEDDDDEDPEEDPVDYPADGGDDGDDEEESSEDDDDDMDIKADEKEEEEEHPAPADSVVVALTVADQALSAKEVEPFESDESAATPPPYPAYRMTARISIPAPVPMPAWFDSEIVRLLAMSSPPASPLSPWSSPPPQIPFPPLPPILSPPSPLPSASRREDRPEVTLPPRKRLGIALGPRYEVGESSSDAAARPAGGLRADYSFVATMDREIMRDLERDWLWDHRLMGRDSGDFTRITNDKQTERQLLAGRLNMLFRDRREHAYTRHLMETEARMSRESWVRSTDASDLVRGEVMSLRTTVLGQMTEIRELHAADRRRHTVILELLRTDHRRHRLQHYRDNRDSLEVLHSQSYQRRLLQAMIDQGVTAALAAQDALRSTNGDDSHNSRTGVRRTERATRECTYTDFLKCQPLPFKGTEGVTSLSQWCERMESETGNGTLDLKVKCTDLASYTQHYQELALLCGRMFSEESDKIEKYIGGLPNMIHGSVVASKPKTMQEAIKIATELIDKKIRTFAELETASKRKFENTSRNTQKQQQQSNKRQNTGQVYTTASGEKKQYGGSKPLCAKCNYHHDGPCAPKCHNCNKIGHFARSEGHWVRPETYML
nr:hypothetical protein [Tanacetum cinerariifolium]